MELLRDAFPGRPAFDIAASHALLLRVARGEAAPAVRLYRPGAAVAFGRLDALRPGYAAARAAARRHGFEPVLRLGGGHAAAFDGGSLVIEEVTPAAAVGEGLEPRFERMTRRLAAAIAASGADARVGELAGEYCAGSWSVNVGGRIKVAGTAQRVVRGAALVTAVVVVAGGDRIRDVLVDVYDALGLEWDPATAGALDDAVPGTDVEMLASDLVAGYGDLAPAELDDATLALAAELEPRHRDAPQ